MYSNFIYFIVVLLIYTTFRPGDNPNFSPGETLFYFVCLVFGYAVLTAALLRRLKTSAQKLPPDLVGQKLSTLLSRQTIVAVALFALYIYGLNLSYFTSGFRPGLKLLQIVPTLEAIAFLLLFMGHLALMWYLAYPLYRRVHWSVITRWGYVKSNLMFALPVLLPWLVLSLVSDLIAALPFEAPRTILSTPQGEIAYFLLFLVAAALFGPAVIQKLWQCVPLQPGVHRQRIENMCRRAGLRYKNILMWPIFEGRMITAGVMGLIRQFRYILVTQALLLHLSPVEIEAVIAHEIGHVKKKHLLFYLLFFVGYMFIAYTLFDLVIYASIYAKPFIAWLQQAGIDQAVVMPALFSIFIITAFLLYFRFIFGYFMRNFERQADIFVFDLLDTAHPLVSTLEKIADASGQPVEKHNWHHFSISERVAYLNRCMLDRSWVGRHHAKVRHALIGYGVGILILGILGYQVSFGEAGQRLDSHFYEKIILQELKKSPDNADLYTMLGDLYYRKKNLVQAGQAYEQALAITADHARALNNLAWIYATAADEKMRDPQRSLLLAKRAAALERAPHILDTLAECYYVNGYYREAVQTSKAALDMVEGKDPYYQEQLRRFEKALQR